MQPFSIGGRHAGAFDARDMWPWTIEATRQLQPRSFVFENVRNLASPTFEPYLDYVKLQLAFPDLRREPDETLESHAARRGAIRSTANRAASGTASAATSPMPPTTASPSNATASIASAWVRCIRRLDAAEATHSAAALDHAKWLSGAYFARHGLTCRNPDEATQKRLRAHNRKRPRARS